MGSNGVNRVWVAVSGASGYVVRCASTLKGVSEEIGASYATMKSKGSKAEMFTIAVGELSDVRVWFVVRLKVRKVSGRGSISSGVLPVKRKHEFKIVK